jgi:hypothetical protein
MDDAVVRALARWPSVPDVYGWLSLDRRGRWLLKGETIGNEALREFINRNYFGLADGAFVFQNGPQRVYVALEAAPWVASLSGTGELELHTGARLETVTGAWVAETGDLYLSLSDGVAIVDDRDLEAISDTWVGADGSSLTEDERELRLEPLLEGGPRGSTSLAMRWAGQLISINAIRSAEIADQFGFIAEPVGAEPTKLSR